MLVLALADGRRSIHTICSEATMLDFEVYNFLYLMVRARILQLDEAEGHIPEREA
ncbi:hypothetical protein JCM30471_12740 [Desulfuromonas carbonis]|uniref:hypothetical protein n=1 Tax=Desulfuromonas sp. DDH964 TaxID=1823759 RepID=UPI00078D4D78|nr:hypothetical protein [Desulfuromonas sp. DDH964]AMV72758.1 hypothetical protein DBW_2421 [Desulfuromonas sp. DDH964]